MGDESFVCRGCRKRRPRNRRLAPDVQRFCSARACQRQRRTRWQRDRVRNDPAYKASQRDADTCWHENTAPDYHKQYRADLKKPTEKRRPRRRILVRKRRLKTITLALGAHELRVSVLPSSAPLWPTDVDRASATDVEVALVRIQSPFQGGAARVRDAKDGRVPTPETLSGRAI